MLRSQLWVRFPAGIEQHEKRTDMVLRCNRKEFVEAFPESFRILLPYFARSALQRGSVLLDAAAPATIGVIVQTNKSSKR